MSCPHASAGSLFLFIAQNTDPDCQAILGREQDVTLSLTLFVNQVGRILHEL